MSALSDTIVALSSAAGRAGVAVVRLSGPDALAIGRDLVGVLPPVRSARLRRARDAAGNVIDVGLVLPFAAPHSYTGEDVAEFQGHGGQALAELVIARCVELGARRAEPGEFTQRAFLNGRLDLAQAEAVADAINAGSNAAALAAMRSLDGAFSAAVNALTTELIELRVYIEAAIDFPDEELDLLSDTGLTSRLAALEASFDALAERLRVGRALTDGLTVALLGRPNAGKSSLMNRLAGHDSAIVTDIPGTTRDLLREVIEVDGLPVTVVDTAGLRTATDDPIEQAGIERARSAAATVDHRLVVIDAAAHAGDSAPMANEVTTLLGEIGGESAHTVVINKTDLARPSDAPPTWLSVSAKTGAGIDALTARLHAVAGYGSTQEGTFSARQRHIDALTEARTAFDRGKAALFDAAAGELLAEELRLAQQALGRITGTFSSDDLLGEIFGAFCIGK
ncbi:MAG: tRNA uridine-5-carboxymethylaminomethyl(34) synthesis GTPase MnmE [Pseudomonadota bacterium]